MDFTKVGKGWKDLKDSVLELDKFKRSQYRTTFGNKESIIS